MEAAETTEAPARLKVCYISISDMAMKDYAADFFKLGPDRQAYRFGIVGSGFFCESSWSYTLSSDVIRERCEPWHLYHEATLSEFESYLMSQCEYHRDHYKPTNLCRAYDYGGESGWMLRAVLK